MTKVWGTNWSLQTKLKLTAYRISYLDLLQAEAAEVNSLKKKPCMQFAAQVCDGASKTGVNQCRGTRVGRFFTTIGAFQKNFCDCYLCVAGQHAFACYYRLRSVDSEMATSKFFWRTIVSSSPSTTPGRRTSNQANWIMSASQKSAVKPKYKLLPESDTGPQ